MDKFLSEIHEAADRLKEQIRKAYEEGDKERYFDLIKIVSHVFNARNEICQMSTEAKRKERDRLFGEQRRKRSTR